MWGCVCVNVPAKRGYEAEASGPHIGFSASLANAMRFV